MGFGFKQPLVGEKRCMTTLITAAEETSLGATIFVILKCRYLYRDDLLEN